MLDKTEFLDESQTMERIFIWIYFYFSILDQREGERGFN